VQDNSVVQRKELIDAMAVQETRRGLTCLHDLYETGFIAGIIFIYLLGAFKLALSY
jgi:hypothetical protein